MTRLGSAYFLLSSTRMKSEVDPLYAISASFIRAAAEWMAGTETLASTLPMMVASRRVHVRDAQRGSKMPL